MSKYATRLKISKDFNLRINKTKHTQAIAVSLAIERLANVKE